MSSSRLATRYSLFARRRSTRSADTDIERTLPAMADVGLFECAHINGKFRQLEPQRHLAAQDTTAHGVLVSAFAGDDEDECGTVGLCAAQETQERRMCLRLCLAVQV